MITYTELVGIVIGRLRTDLTYLAYKEACEKTGCEGFARKQWDAFDKRLENEPELRLELLRNLV